jgi:CTP:molybdopterin cytidylyltransferase MocA
MRQAMELTGDAGARELLQDAAVRKVEVAHLCRPTDVDTPADLESLRR